MTRFPNKKIQATSVFVLKSYICQEVHVVCYGVSVSHKKIGLTLQCTAPLRLHVLNYIAHSSRLIPGVLFNRGK